MALPFGSIGQLALGNLVSRGADRLLNPEQRNNRIINSLIPGGGITGQSTGIADIRGDGEFIMKIRRFIPDFISQTGNTQVTLQLRDFPNNAKSSSSLGPFTVTSSTTKVDTRARARQIALKVANTAASQSWKLGTFRLDIQPDGRR